MLILFWKFVLPIRLIEPTHLFNFGNCSYLHVISNCALIKEVRVDEFETIFLHITLNILVSKATTPSLNENRVP